MTENEDPYEFAVTWLYEHIEIEDYWGIYPDEWTTEEEAMEQADSARRQGRRSVKLVKRRKAGPVEDA